MGRTGSSSRETPPALSRKRAAPTSACSGKDTTGQNLDQRGPGNKPESTYAVISLRHYFPSSTATTQPRGARRALRITVYGTGVNGTVTIESGGTSLSASAEAEPLWPGTQTPGKRVQRFHSAAATWVGGRRTIGSQTAAGDSSDPHRLQQKPEESHREGCQYLRKSKIPISLSEAKAQGLEPCSKCPTANLGQDHPT